MDGWTVLCAGGGGAERGLDADAKREGNAGREDVVEDDMAAEARWASIRTCTR